MAAETAEQEERDPSTTTNNNNDNINNPSLSGMSRKEKRKLLKKLKRKKVRRESAIKEREAEEAKENDPEEQLRVLKLEQEERERMERDVKEFEERERRFRLELEKKAKEQQQEEEKQKIDDENANKSDEGDDDWEYVEEGPAEIIWKGNEIIVKKKKVKVTRKKPDDLQTDKKESEGPISNPLAPQSEAFEDFKSAQEVLESVAQQVPNFGTEQDKAHCPFHLKTGACRFGARCSRVHFYPDKSCTILIKNMYHGPGLSWEQDEGLECTDEEVERSFEEFYEDVHTEFLKFGELMNFKVCRNASLHLRGNVYVHYKNLESAVLACHSINGRYFGGKQVTCEFINLTKWKVAICGEFMRSRLKTCSRGSACNFIHCFRNPGGDYEWADWDKPAPKYWLKRMSALFGYPDNTFTDEVSPRSYHSRGSTPRDSDTGYFRTYSDEDDDRNRERRLRQRGTESTSRGSDTARGKRHSDEDDDWNRGRWSRQRDYSREGAKSYHHIKQGTDDDEYSCDGISEEYRASTMSSRSSKRERSPLMMERHSSSGDHKSSSKRKKSGKENDRSRNSKRSDKRSPSDEGDTGYHTRYGSREGVINLMDKTDADEIVFKDRYHSKKRTRDHSYRKRTRRPDLTKEESRTEECKTTSHRNGSRSKEKSDRYDEHKSRHQRVKQRHSDTEAASDGGSDHEFSRKSSSKRSKRTSRLRRDSKSGAKSHSDKDGL